MRLLDAIHGSTTWDFIDKPRHRERWLKRAKVDASKPAAVAEQALEYYNTGRFEEALSDIEAMLQAHPDDLEICFLRAYVFESLERYDEALADYNVILGLCPDEPDVLIGRGNAYLHMGRYDEAWTDYQRALEIEPGYPCAIYNLACVHSLQGNAEEALTHLADAVKRQPSFLELARWDPDMAPIRGDKEVRALLGLPPVH
jgi:tetratricopeptide (TPR) repeat protein